MKKAACVLFGFFFLTFSLSGCAEHTAYVAPAESCIVSIPDGFLLAAPENSETVCQKIDTEIKDMKKTDGRDYYCVTKNAPLEIVRYESWFEYDGKDQSGSGKVISGFQKGEQTTTFTLHHADFIFSCSENCDIEPIYESFTTVGQIFVEKPENADFDFDYLYDATNFFYENGAIRQRAGLSYLYLKDDFGDMPDCWNTNLTVKSFACTARDGTVVSATFTVDKLADDFAACVICRYDVRGDYFISFVSLSGESGVMISTTMDVGKNELTVHFS